MLIAPHLVPAIRVWQRESRAFARSWRTSILPPFLDPLLFLLCFGFGLGALVASVDGISYQEFVAPGLCASAVMWVASFESTFGFFWKMDVIRLHENLLTTPIEAEDIVLGELLWSATRATLYGSAYLCVIAVLGFVDTPFALALPPCLFVGGLVFGAMAMSFTVFNSRLEHFGYYFTLVVNPLFLFGGIFFPLDRLPGWAQDLAWFTPTAHVVDLSRGLTTMPDMAAAIGDVVWLGVATAVIALVPMWKLRRRLVP